MRVLAFGTFDLLHPGHIHYLKQCAKHGDLFVVVARDKTVKEVKKESPIQSEKIRKKHIDDLNFVKKAVLGNFDDKYKVIEDLIPDIICLGYDQKHFVSKLDSELKKRGVDAKIIRMQPHNPDKYKSSVRKKRCETFLKLADDSHGMETGVKVGDVMIQGVVTVDAKTTLSECAEIMKEKAIGSLIVVEDNKPVGIITDQDFTRKVVATGMDPNVQNIGQIMSKNLHTIASDKDVYNACVLMGNMDVKHLPVVNQGELVGIISFKDIMRIQPDLIDVIALKSAQQEHQQA